MDSERRDVVFLLTSAKVMNELKIQFLYGQEFWDKLGELLANAKERVFLLSAFIKKETHDEYTALIPPGVFQLTGCRSDNKKFQPEGALIIDQEHFHGKIYLVDNTIIIGSQNLYYVGKEGEFSTLIETDGFNSSLILYQALLKTIEDTDTEAEPVHPDFFTFYDDEGCPFCGNEFMPEATSLHVCPGYGFGFVTDDECSSYGGDGACKWCLVESRDPIGDAMCCDNERCGLGISMETRNLLYHAINPTRKKELQSAKNFLRLFNYFKKQELDAVEIFRRLGFIGQVYDTHQDRKLLHFVNNDILKGK